MKLKPLSFIPLVAACLPVLNAQIVIDDFTTPVSYVDTTFGINWLVPEADGTASDLDANIGEIRIDDGIVGGAIGERTWQYNLLSSGMSGLGGDRAYINTTANSFIWSHGGGITELSMEYDLGAGFDLTDGGISKFFQFSVLSNDRLTKFNAPLDPYYQDFDALAFDMAFTVQDGSNQMTVSKEFLATGDYFFDFASFSGVDLTNATKLTITVGPGNALAPIGADIAFGIIQTTAVPEPSTYALLSFFACTVALVIRRRMKHAA